MYTVVKLTYMGMNVIVTLEKELFQEIIESPKWDYCRASIVYISVCTLKKNWVHKFGFISGLSLHSLY